jgi:leucyl aminopeptidase
MHPVFATAGKNQAIPIWFVNAANFDEVRKKLGSSERAFISTAAFEAKAGRSLLLPDGNGKLAGVLFGIEGPDDPDHDRFSRDNWSVFCRREPTVSPTGRTTHGSRH